MSKKSKVRGGRVTLKKRDRPHRNCPVPGRAHSYPAGKIWRCGCEKVWSVTRDDTHVSCGCGWERLVGGGD